MDIALPKTGGKIDLSSKAVGGEAARLLLCHDGADLGRRRRQVIYLFLGLRCTETASEPFLL